VRLRFHLTALGETDAAEYIRHRLRIAGAGDREIFEPGTIPLIYRYTGGIPRLTNTLCDTALLSAFAQDHTTVSMEDLKSAIAELQWVEYAARTSTQLRPGIDDTAPQEMPPVGRLVLSLKGEIVTEAYLVPGRFIIGRTSDNDLQVDSRFVSRHHAQVVTTVEGSWIEDLNSTNGIYVRGKRIRRHRLAEGDVVQIGQHSLTYSRADLGGSTVAMDPDADADADVDVDVDVDDADAEAEGDESVAADHR
jgi:hypothetical protein